MKALTIAKYTFIEVLKSRIMYLSLFLGVLVFILSFVAREFTYGVPDRVTLDVGLGLISLTGAGLGIFFGINIVSKEIENRTLYMVLSRPVGRKSYFLGRVIGMSYVLILNIMIISAFTLLGYITLKSNAFDSLIWWVIINSLIESLIVLGVAVLFSLVTNMTMSAVYSIVVYVIGYSLGESMKLQYVENHPGLAVVIKIANAIFPNFSRLNLKEYVLYNSSLDSIYLSMNVLYGLGYFVAILLLGLLVFNKKELV